MKPLKKRESIFTFLLAPFTHILRTCSHSCVPHVIRSAPPAIKSAYAAFINEITCRGAVCAGSKKQQHCKYIWILVTLKYSMNVTEHKLPAMGLSWRGPGPPGGTVTQIIKRQQYQRPYCFPSRTRPASRVQSVAFFVTWTAWPGTGITFSSSCFPTPPHQAVSQVFLLLLWPPLCWWTMDLWESTAVSGKVGGLTRWLQAWGTATGSQNCSETRARQAMTQTENCF